MHLDFAAEELCAGQRAVDDVEVDCGCKDEDEDRREEEVGDEGPAGSRLPHHVFNVCVKGSHARTRSTKTSSRVLRRGERSVSMPPLARSLSTRALRCSRLSTSSST